MLGILFDFKNNTWPWIAISSILLLSLIVFFTTLSTATSRYTTYREDGKYEGSATWGGFMIGLSIAMFAAADYVSWQTGPYGMPSLVSLYLAAPLFLMGLWHIASDFIPKIGVSDKVIRLAAGATFIHLAVSVLFILSHSTNLPDR